MTRPARRSPGSSARWSRVACDHGPTRTSRTARARARARAHARSVREPLVVAVGRDRSPTRPRATPSMSRRSRAPWLTRPRTGSPGRGRMSTRHSTTSEVGRRLLGADTVDWLSSVRSGGGRHGPGGAGRRPGVDRPDEPLDRAGRGGRPGDGVRRRLGGDHRRRPPHHVDPDRPGRRERSERQRSADDRERDDVESAAARSPGRPRSSPVAWRARRSSSTAT